MVRFFETAADWLVAGLLLVLAVLLVTLAAGVYARLFVFERDPDDISLTGGHGGVAAKPEAQGPRESTPA